MINNKSLLTGLAACLLMGFPVRAAADTTPPEKAALPPLKIEFEADERRYAVMAWLYWVGDRDPAEVAGPHFAEEKMLKDHLSAQELPAEMHKRHRQAYEGYLSGSTLYEKNGLLLSASMAYGQPPSFSSKPFASLESAERARSDAMLDNLPPAAVMAEFYQGAKLHELWEQRMKEAHDLALERYRPRAEKLMQETYALLKVPMRVPVSLRINLLGSYGILGQTAYSPWERRYLISLHFNPISPAADKVEVDYWETANLRVIRHELSHALLNDVVKKHQHLLAPKLTRLAQALDLDWLKGLQVEALAPEWIADCIGNLDLKANLHDRVVYYNRNPLYWHFIENLPSYRASGKSFAEFIPEFFASFDADAEITRWKVLVGRKKAGR